MGRLSGRIVVAGGGMAGLTAALAFAQRGIPVRLFERSPEPREAGAGLQLSPNASRLLARLGVLELLEPAATLPHAVILRDATTLRELARVPLGEAATRRWGAPYLVLHRADLRAALAQAVARQPEIEVASGTLVTDAIKVEDGYEVSVVGNGHTEQVPTALLVAADGVWSGLRASITGAARSSFSGTVAWRATLPRTDPALSSLAGHLDTGCVTTFLHRRAHLVTYPIRGGQSVNLVGLARGTPGSETWSAPGDGKELAASFTGAGALCEAIRAAGPWTVWPIHTVDPAGAWTDRGGAALIGDAAHAMTPFAAQGAAAAIEDAYVLAACVADGASDLGTALARYEALRRPRIRRMAKRGDFNAFAWHAAGPIALARNAVLSMRGGERLAADLDWLYGWDADEELGVRTA